MSDAPRPALGELARLATAAEEAFIVHLREREGPKSAPTYVAWRAACDSLAAACSPAVILQLVALASGGAAMREALEQIAKGEGRYSRDPLTHAENTIADMKALAPVPSPRSAPPMRNSPRRLFWKLASPFAWCAHKLGWCSYKWRNVCYGARRPDLFDPLWQYEWYGAPVREIPNPVILCGCAYRTGASEGIVTFVEDFTKRRITLERDAIALEALWYVALTGDTTPASHIDAAYRWVKAVYGGSHEWREPA